MVAHIEIFAGVNFTSSMQIRAAYKINCFRRALTARLGFISIYKEKYIKRKLNPDFYGLLSFSS